MKVGLASAALSLDPPQWLQHSGYVKFESANMWCMWFRLGAWDQNAHPSVVGNHVEM